MFRATRMLLTTGARYRGTVKSSTGICGLEVDPNARNKLIGLYERTIMKAKASPNYNSKIQYNKWCDEFSTARLSILRNKNLTDQECEKEIDMGQLEELCVMAEDELKLFDILNDKEFDDKTQYPDFAQPSDEAVKLSEDALRIELSKLCGFEWKPEWPLELPAPGTVGKGGLTREMLGDLFDAQEDDPVNHTNKN